MRRVLIPTYYWPPSGGPGVQRVLKFVRYLESFGWQPTVLTVRNGAYPNRDATLSTEIPSSIPVHRTASWDPYTLYAWWLGTERDDAVSVEFLNGSGRTIRKRLARWIRANVFIPDARVGWVPFGMHAPGQSMENIDAVFSTGPPHSTHLIARHIVQEFDLPWVADFRDPWTDVSYKNDLPASRLARRFDAELERKVLRDANVVTTVSPSWRDLLADKTDSRVALIRNGFDPNDFHGIERDESNAFVVTYVGNFTPSRNPEALWPVMSELRKEGHLSRLRIRLVGNVDHTVLRDLRHHGLWSVLERVPYVPHRQALQFMMDGSLLLLTLNNSDGPEFHGHIPAKLYEYLASGRPVLGIGGTETDAANLLARTGGGTMLDFGDRSGMRRVLRDYHDRSVAHRPAANMSHLTKLTRRYQTGALADILDSVSVDAVSALR